MRITCVRLAQHIDRTFKQKWLIQRRRMLHPTRAEANLVASGIKIYDAHEVLTPAVDVPQIQFEFPKHMQRVVDEEKTPRYVFKELYSPPGGVAQIQNLTNTVIRHTLPECVLTRVRESTEEEDAQVQESVLHCHLQDSHQEKLPRIWDVINRPGWSYPREYGAPVKRKNFNMTYHLILLLERLHPDTAKRCLVDRTKVKINLTHSDNSFQLDHRAAFNLTGATPLSPPVDKGEINGTEEELLPDIYPISPFLHCHKLTKYADEDYDQVASSGMYPHTIFLHLNMPRMPHTEDSFTGVTLLKVFSHAAAFAKLHYKIEDGDLEKPVTLNVVHTNGKQYQIGVYQLNTLNLNGQKKNIFWHTPLTNLFDNCNFEMGEAKLKGYNPEIFSQIRALYLQ